MPIPQNNTKDVNTGYKGVSNQDRAPAKHIQIKQQSWFTKYPQTPTKELDPFFRPHVKVP